jgi:hypothetical protein
MGILPIFLIGIRSKAQPPWLVVRELMLELFEPFELRGFKTPYLEHHLKNVAAPMP